MAIGFMMTSLAANETYLPGAFLLSVLALISFHTVTILNNADIVIDRLAVDAEDPCDTVTTEQCEDATGADT